MVLTVGDNTTSTPGNAHLAVNEYYSSSSYSLIDKVTNTRELNEQILKVGVVERDGEMVGACGCVVLEYGYDVGDVVSREEVSVICCP